jgi:hypothetical protein
MNELMRGIQKRGMRAIAKHAPTVARAWVGAARKAVGAIDAHRKSSDPKNANSSNALDDNSKGDSPADGSKDDKSSNDANRDNSSPKAGATDGSSPAVPPDDPANVANSPASALAGPRNQGGEDFTAKSGNASMQGNLGGGDFTAKSESSSASRNQALGNQSSEASARADGTIAPRSSQLQGGDDFTAKLGEPKVGGGLTPSTLKAQNEISQASKIEPQKLQNALQAKQGLAPSRENLSRGNLRRGPQGDLGMDLFENFGVDENTSGDNNPSDDNLGSKPEGNDSQDQSSGQLTTPRRPIPRDGRANGILKKGGLNVVKAKPGSSNAGSRKVTFKDSISSSKGQDGSSSQEPPGAVGQEVRGSFSKAPSLSNAFPQNQASQLPNQQVLGNFGGNMTIGGEGGIALAGGNIMQSHSIKIIPNKVSGDSSSTSSSSQSELSGSSRQSALSSSSRQSELSSSSRQSALSSGGLGGLQEQYSNGSRLNTSTSQRAKNTNVGNDGWTKTELIYGIPSADSSRRNGSVATKGRVPYGTGGLTAKSKTTLSLKKPKSTNTKQKYSSGFEEIDEEFTDDERLDFGKTYPVEIDPNKKK